MSEWYAALPAPLLIGLGLLWAALIAASLAVMVLAMRGKASDELKDRTRTWWWIIVPLTVALLLGVTAVTLLFTLVSFLALREFMSIIPVRQVDRVAILLAYLAIPAQYFFVYDDWYGMFSIFIPVYVAAALSFRLVLAGETRGFIRSMGTLQWGLFLTVYNLSHVAFLMELDVAEPLPAGGAGLVLYLLMIVALNDVAQYAWGKSIGGPKVLPKVSPGKTVAGFVGGMGTAALAAAVLAPLLTPFAWWVGALVGAGLGFLGFAGDVTVSALKRDLAIKDAGSILPGHGGMLDRLDSLLFAAPIFLHFTRYFYGA